MESEREQPSSEAVRARSVSSYDSGSAEGFAQAMTGGSAQAVLALQRMAGNRAVSDLVSKRGYERQVARQALLRSPQEEELAALETQKAGFLRRRDKLQKFVGTAQKDIEAYRKKFRWVNGSYTEAYKAFKDVLTKMNASIDSEQKIVNLMYSMANNVAIGALGNALQEAKKISQAINLWGGSAVNTGTGLGSPEIPKAAVTEELHPALRVSAGLQKLDELNETVLSILANTLFPIYEPTRVVEEVIGETRVAEAKGKRKLTDAELADRKKQLAKFDEQGGTLEPVLDKVLQELDNTRAVFYKSPWPTLRRAEQDIWIMWMSQQKPIGTWGVVRWSVLGRPELHDRLIELGLATRHIWAKPNPPKELSGGRLGAATEGIRMEAVNGQLVDISGPEMLSIGAQTQAPFVARYWASVFLSGLPPADAGKEW